MSGYDPNQSMLPASGGGNIVAMSGGGVAQQHGSGGAGLVFANGGDPKIIRFKRALLEKQRELAKTTKARRQQMLQTVKNTMTKLNPRSSASGSASASTSASGSASAPTSASASTPIPASASTSTSAPIPASAPTGPISAPASASASTSTTTTSSTIPAPTATASTTSTASNINIEDILKKLIGSLPKTKDSYTSEEQDSILKNLTPLLYPDTENKVQIEVK